VKTSIEEGCDVYLTYTGTHANSDVWFIESGASFHMTPHREWFSEYEKYDGGDVFLGDLQELIIGSHIIWNSLISIMKLEITTTPHYY
jgi:hypothetical protein